MQAARSATAAACRTVASDPFIETAIEDGVPCERMDRGRRALYEQGLDDAGPCQSPMEDAERHFHERVRRNLARDQ